MRVNTHAAQREPHKIRLLVVPHHSVATDDDHEWLVASRNALD
ncbi:MAG TPA: hypothetical protein VJQ52_02885 [Steroidobacteraceae bacterium]|nr:hypothetical protein [Steroidobacteraceae bacterium]